MDTRLQWFRQACLQDACTVSCHVLQTQRLGLPAVYQDSVLFADSAAVIPAEHLHVFAALVLTMYKSPSCPERQNCCSMHNMQCSVRRAACKLCAAMMPSLGVTLASRMHRWLYLLPVVTLLRCGGTCCAHGWQQHSAQISTSTRHHARVRPIRRYAGPSSLIRARQTAVPSTAQVALRLLQPQMHRACHRLGPGWYSSQCLTRQCIYCQSGLSPLPFYRHSRWWLKFING